MSCRFSVSDVDTNDITNDALLDLVSRFLLAALIKHCGLCDLIVSDRYVIQRVSIGIALIKHCGLCDLIVSDRYVIQRVSSRCCTFPLPDYSPPCIPHLTDP